MFIWLKRAGDLQAGHIHPAQVQQKSTINTLPMLYAASMLAMPIANHLPTFLLLACHCHLRSVAMKPKMMKAISMSINSKKTEKLSLLFIFHSSHYTNYHLIKNDIMVKMIFNIYNLCVIFLFHTFPSRRLCDRNRSYICRQEEQSSLQQVYNIQQVAEILPFCVHHYPRHK